MTVQYDLAHLPEVLREHARRAHFRWPSTASYITEISEYWQRFVASVDYTFTGEPIRAAVIEALANQDSVAFDAFYDYYRTTVVSSHVDCMMRGIAKVSHALADAHSAIIVFKKFALERLYRLHDAAVASWTPPSADDYASAATDLAFARQKAQEEVRRYANELFGAQAILETTIAAMARDLQKLPRSTLTKPPR
jgi:hypothetical protein